MIIIRHTHEDGTLIEGSCKGDGVYEIARRHGFSYFPSIRAIGIRGSRDRVANRRKINAAAEALRAGGHEVTVEINDTPRDRATVLADQADRLDDRREALESKASRHLAASDAAFSRASQIAERFAFGQPILVGHHSERSARADQRRIEAAMQRSRTEYGIGRDASHRAGAVGSSAAYSGRPGVTARRIETAEAELRKIQRKLDGHTRNFRDHAGNLYHVEKHEPASGEWREQLLARKTQLEGQLAYDRQHLAGAEEAGEHTTYGPDNVHVGDLISFGGARWHQVVKVNRVTVSVETGYSWTDKIRFTSIRRVKAVEHA